MREIEHFKMFAYFKSNSFKILQLDVSSKICNDTETMLMHVSLRGSTEQDHNESKQSLIPCHVGFILLHVRQISQYQDHLSEMLGCFFGK